jgi:hypothetical protein
VRHFWGRAFVHPLFDLLVIGGGLSLIVLAYLALEPASGFSALVRGNLWLLIWVSNSAHFAGSTVRLYTKPGTFKELPFVTMALPALTFAVLALGLVWPRPLGQSLQALYLTWSPYHYAAQAFGLSLMYCYRGEGVSDGQRTSIRYAAVLPFFYVFLTGSGSGVEWLLPSAILRDANAAAFRFGLAQVVLILALALPVLVYALSLRPGRRRLPMISVCTLVSNSLWLTVIAGSPALFGIATVFHGLQYLAILTIFHARERRRLQPEGPSGLIHAARFYALCLGLGYLLFRVWPYAGLWFGLTYAESAIVSVAIINIHHFLVDGFIWRLRGDRNYATVKEAALQPA